ncbi:hypothetical protein [Alkalihalobacillus trypoxylicola]|nr:hypothetical protein [Alkalihalobacillus trypoxylicola]
MEGRAAERVKTVKRKSSIRPKKEVDERTGQKGKLYWMEELLNE